MKRCGTVEFTKGELYKITDVKFEKYYLINNHGGEHSISSGEFFAQHFEVGLTPEERFDKAMGKI